LIYNIEKTIADLGGKAEESDKTDVEEKTKAMRELLDTEDIEAFDKAFEELQSAAFALSQKLYQSQQETESTGDEVIDAEVVNEG
jgi:molecular chaperone DnaK